MFGDRRGSGMDRNVVLGISLSILAGLLVFAMLLVGGGAWATVLAFATMAVLFYLCFAWQPEKGWLPVALAMICFTLGACLTIDHILFCRGAISTESDSWFAEGPVGRGRVSKAVFVVKVIFVDQQGTTHIAETRAITPEDGATLTVIYPMADPSRARVGGWLFWKLPLAIAILGGGLLLVGIFLMVRRRRVGRDRVLRTDTVASG
jgi:multisubunit Na+/H+ antiporter MnhB subunit